jgi:hypothetical protein
VTIGGQLAAHVRAALAGASDVREVKMMVATCPDRVETLPAEKSATMFKATSMRRKS